MKPQILVVDDSPDFRLLIRIYLQRAFDVDVIEAVSAPEAISILQSDKIQLVICDFLMSPQTGLVVFQYLQLNPEIHSRFIMFSAYLDQMDYTERSEMVAISKPDFQKLLRKVDELGVAHGQ